MARFYIDTDDNAKAEEVKNFCDQRGISFQEESEERLENMADSQTKSDLSTRSNNGNPKPAIVDKLDEFKQRM
jgi:hypothetical protein